MTIILGEREIAIPHLKINQLLYFSFVFLNILHFKNIIGNFIMVFPNY